MFTLLKSALAGLVLAVCLFGTAVAAPQESSQPESGFRDFFSGTPAENGQTLYRITAPDGQLWEIDGPEGFSQAYMIGVIVSQQVDTGLSRDGAFWLRMAADRGDVDAQMWLGLLYSSGRGVPQDYVQAVAWHRKAADQGNAFAQKHLGNAYEDGQGVPQDYVQAVAWYRKAADQGDASAQWQLATLYGNGQGVPVDYDQAYKWLSLSAARMEPGPDRDVVLRDRDFFAAKLDANRLAQAQSEASSWRPQTEPASAENFLGGLPSPWVAISIFAAIVILVAVGIVFAARRKTPPTTLASHRGTFATGGASASVGMVGPVISPEASPPQALPVLPPSLQPEPQTPTAETANTPKPWVRSVAPMTTAYRVVFIVLICLAILGLYSGGLLTVIFGYSAWLMHKRNNVDLVKCFRVLSYFYGISLFAIFAVIVYVSGGGYTVDIYLFVLSVMANGLLLLCVFLTSFFKRYITSSAEAPVG